MRGNRVVVARWARWFGSIPAHAGKPPPGRRSVAVNRVGSIPAHAGKPSSIVLRRTMGRAGSIPAHAGKPWPYYTYVGPTRVYPRPCGETMVYTYVGPTRVYPRPCGETEHANIRGPVDVGSIPAHAGKPAGRFECPPADRVYPRMRGNLSDSLRSRLIGSIPAHAGKPLRQLRWDCPTRVYPRPCGETEEFHDFCQLNEGLSPPMRGNHRKAHDGRGCDEWGLSPPMRGNRNE